MFFDANKKKLKTIPPTIQLQNEVIPASQTVKYLGFLIDIQLSFKAHILQLIGKLSRLVGVYRKITSQLSLQAKYLLYYSTFYSLILYCLEIYGTANSTLIKKMQTTQNKAVRALFAYSKYYPTDNMYKELKLEIVFRIQASVFIFGFY
jgi:hypothetical protein